jgi:hypothetical protein
MISNTAALEEVMKKYTDVIQPAVALAVPNGHGQMTHAA